MRSVAVVVPWKYLLCLTMLAALPACSGETGRLPTAPQATVLVDSNRFERRMTENEAHAFLLAGDPAYADWVARTGGRPILGSQSASLSRSEDDVTEDGAVAGFAHVSINVAALPHLAAWSSHTQVISGFARRVYMLAQGQYSSYTNATQRFSSTCGDGTFELFKQECGDAKIYCHRSCEIPYLAIV